MSKDWREYLHTKLCYDWTLSSTCRDNLECYFLRHWEYAYLKSKVDTSTARAIYLDYEGNRYTVMFYPSMDQVIGVHSQVALSFRKPKPELNLPAYVLVKGIENKS